MSLDGFAGFAAPYLLDDVYIDGSWLEQVPLQIERSPGVFLLPTQAGTHIAQRLYRGAGKPADYNALTFTFNARALKEAAWYALREAKAKASPVYFAPGVRETDTFPATSGNAYRLTRRLAAGIVPGVTSGNGSGTHPTVVKLNGAVNNSAATISGQDVTAAATGTITITYTPVHLVYFAAFPETISDFNITDAQIKLEEVVGA